MLMRRPPGVRARRRGPGCRCGRRGSVSWSILSSAERGEVAQRVRPGRKKYAPPRQGGERRQSLVHLADRPLGDVKSSVPSWVPKIGSCSLPSSWNVLSLIQTFCANSNWRTRSGADDERGDAALDAVVGRAVGQRRAVGGAAADHPAAVHVVRGVARVQAPGVRSQRAGVAVRIHLLVVEVVVAHADRRPAPDRRARAPAPAARRCASGP